MPSIRAPGAKKSTTLTVAVKCRPLRERERGRDIVRVIESKEVLILDPDLSKDYLDRIQNRTKEKQYCFDHAFGPESTNLEVYTKSISSIMSGVVQGLNVTVFAYGSTGSGKTYTMVGTKEDPGLMVLSLHTVFDLIKKDKRSDEFEVTCSYLEVYNEVIYDLLEKSSGHLELREDPEQGITVAGLKCIKVRSADKILELLNMGNSRRKTDCTEVNATSSRSHAVLEISVKRKQRNKYPNQVLHGKLALVDLAGSERATETNNSGQKLRDGANINRSLLALANCINALGKQQKKGLAYVPYRNSKLTRILKDGLSGNSQTVMIATISPADIQYHHTVNTLKYADRAKEIKTHVQKNIGAVDSHVSDYQRMIDSLQTEVCQLKKKLAEKESQLSTKPAEKAADDELSWLNIVSHEISENVQERINLQKAMYELEETNLNNRSELQRLDDSIARPQAIEIDGAIVEDLIARRLVILDNIRDNDEAGINYQKEIEANEKQRCQLQGMIDEAVSRNGNKTYLQILSQYRLLGMANSELQLEMAMRDQVIHNQRESLKNLWNLLMGLGLDEKQILHLAAKQGLTIEGWTITPSLGLLEKQSSNLSSSRSTSVGPSSGIEEGNQNFCDFPCPDFSPPVYSRARNVDAKPNMWSGSPERHPRDLYKSYLDMTSHASHGGSCMSSSSVVGDIASSRRIIEAVPFTKKL
ncbi:kinesin-like protein KIN-8B isoform X1 [Benincasa hispida]|uniref:kinesin-like protein KIN-8B isoform X1 n=2 Tax=Benincasa hispida TaxID=102211 RepID=UPI001902844B|nr:kinesin-like protein KIN-8B isoform X1 [Benincasa hispida]